MQCVSCQADINPRWKHAIEINTCPSCGSSIMAEHLKNLLITLNSTMIELQQYPDQLNDWLLSNYNYIKTDSPQLSIYLPKEYAKIKELKTEEKLSEKESSESKTTVMRIKDRDGVEQDVIVEKISSDDKAKEFFDRANPIGKSMKGKVLPGQEPPKSIPEKTQYLKGIKQQIEKEAVQGIISQATMADMINADKITENNNESPNNMVSQMSSMISGGEDLPISSEAFDDGMEPIPNIILSMAGAASNNPGAPNQKDMQFLEKNKSIVSNAQNRMKSGAGKFSRG